MESLKIGRTEYKIQKGDYLQDNGSSIMFCSGDGRTLRRMRHDSFDYVVLTKKLLKDINLSELRKVDLVKSSINLIRYYF